MRGLIPLEDIPWRDFEIVLEEALRKEKRDTHRDMAIHAIARSKGYGSDVSWKKRLQQVGILEKVKMTEEEKRQRKAAAHAKAQEIWRKDR